MSRGSRRSVGLLGRLLGILLLTVVIEFAASTLLYERSSHALIRDDEARRLAEHLVIARKLISEQPWAERPAMAGRLSTDRYDVHWSGSTERSQPSAPALEAMRAKVVDWEPALAGTSLSLRLVAAGREPWLIGDLRLPDNTWMHFRAAAPASLGDRALNRIMLALLPAAVLLLFGALMFRRTLRPMETLARAAERIGRGGGVTLPVSGPAEVRRLIRAFNTMQIRIRQLIADRTQALAAVSHDLRTLLARMQLRTDAIADPTLRHAFEADVAEMEAMVQSLLAYLGGEHDPEAAARIDVAVLAATVVDSAVDRGADAIYEGDDHLSAQVRPGGLKRAIDNLVENALHYAGQARVSVTAEGDDLVIRVEDDGPGIPDGRLEDVVRPFIRLDPSRGRNTTGLGLGLAIVARAAEMEGGALRLVNRPEGGLRAELRLPRR
ncbi:ATP-binding protein [uncultured Sphingomonas sp.]|uniref:ATP-binding protein n=1 Tax=uncultured Sphingomonas sp. TaxID=158754 RepID=UPI002625CCA7|nr:ATP-binding protein [uncultured Sphingomonas sp.]